MAKVNGFRRGSAVYNCVCCGRATRETGVQGMGSQTCPQCYELAGFENSVQDGCFDDNDAEFCSSLIKELVAKGVPLAKLQQVFNLLPAAVFA